MGFFPQPKGPTLALERASSKTAERRLHRAFRKAVIDRDGTICRCCGRPVVKLLERVPKRLEVHHTLGRSEIFRYEPRAALVLCFWCHSKITGEVGCRWAIFPGRHARVFRGDDGQEYLDVGGPVEFVRIA